MGQEPIAKSCPLISFAQQNHIPIFATIRCTILKEAVSVTGASSVSQSLNLKVLCLVFPGVRCFFFVSNLPILCFCMQCGWEEDMDDWQALGTPAIMCLHLSCILILTHPFIARWLRFLYSGSPCFAVAFSCMSVEQVRFCISHFWGEVSGLAPFAVGGPFGGPFAVLLWGGIVSVYVMIGLLIRFHPVGVIGCSVFICCLCSAAGIGVVGLVSLISPAIGRFKHTQWTLMDLCVILLM